MPTSNPVAVTPIAQRAKWAQRRTEYDEADAPAPVPPQPKPDRRRVAIVVDADEPALDRVLAFAERHVNVVGVF